MKEKIFILITDMFRHNNNINGIFWWVIDDNEPINSNNLFIIKKQNEK